MKSSNKTLLNIIGILFFLTIGFYTFSNFLLTSNPKYKPLTEAQKKDRQQKNDAALNAQLLVKGKLKSPSTAKFPPTSTAKITKSATDTWIVTSYVDSQNGFGAMIRNNWVAKIRYLPSKQVELVSIHFQE